MVVVVTVDVTVSVETDVDTLVKRFCEARYGPFAGEARAALLALQDVTRSTCSVKNSTLKPAAKIEADSALLNARLKVILDNLNTHQKNSAG